MRKVVLKRKPEARSQKPEARSRKPEETLADGLLLFAPLLLAALALRGIADGAAQGFTHSLGRRTMPAADIGKQKQHANGSQSYRPPLPLGHCDGGSCGIGSNATWRCGS